MAIACFGISAVALAALKLERATTAIPTHGGEYVEGVVGQPAYANPVLALTEIDRSLVRLIFSNVPALAEKLEAGDRQRSWNIRLRENLTWHDGAKLTSDDVIFTIQKIQDPESRSPLALSWQGITVRRVSELEFIIQLPSPYIFFTENLNNLFVLPKHLFADIPTSNWRLSAYNLKPIGSGPYQFDSYHQQPDGFIDRYALRAIRTPSSLPPGRADTPHVAAFTMEFFRNMDEAFKAFNAGKIDGLGGVDMTLLNAIQRPYTLHAFTTPSYYAVFLNGTHNNALKEPVVRSVLSRAVDREMLVSRALEGYGLPQAGPLLESSPQATSTEVSTSTPRASSSSLSNEAQLIQELEAAGWKMTTSSEARVRFEGNASTTLKATLLVPQVPFLITTAEMLRDSWQRLGVAVTLRPTTPEEILASAIRNRDYEMLLFGNVLNPAEDLFPFWHSSQRFYPGLNIGLYNNKKADALTEEIRGESNEENRENKLAALATLITADVPAIFLYSPEYLFVTAKNVGGVQPRRIANPPERFLNAAAWYVKTARVLK